MPSRSKDTVQVGPLQSRELNGAELVEELEQVRRGAIEPEALAECARLISELEGLSANEAALRLRRLASGPLGAQPALAVLVVHRAAQLRVDADVDVVVGHFRRLSLLAGLAEVARRLSDGGEEVPS